MTVSGLCDALSLRVFHLSDGQRTVSGGYAGDLLSWVMGRAREDSCWITIMSNANVAAVALMADVACVLLAEGVEPDDDLLRRAGENDIALLGSGESVFSLCARVSALL